MASARSRARKPGAGRGATPLGSLASATGPGPFRIQAVTQMTGVPEPTLRAWERRYGVPLPDRTSSGYRLYGQHQLRQVREIRRLCQEGMSAAQAAEIVLSERPPDNEPPASHDPFGSARESLVDAIERFDDTQLDAALRRVMFLGPGTDVIDRLFTPLLHTIGERWHAGQLSIAQEHFASQRLGAALGDLLRLGRDEAGAAAVFACFAQEQHELGLLSTAVRLAGWGLRPIFLGARVPPEALRSAIESSGARLVALSVTIAPPKGQSRRLVAEYASACCDVPWIVGGAGASAMARAIAARGGRVAPADSTALHSLVLDLLDGGPTSASRPRSRS